MGFFADAGLRDERLTCISEELGEEIRIVEID
jgi:hypothetical protein